ncbi:hypothetical protein GC584_10815 [Corynebacterium sp. zg912]|nr:hypothetical protein [Corynebacterium sp. zg912]
MPDTLANFPRALEMLGLAGFVAALPLADAYLVEPGTVVARAGPRGCVRPVAPGGQTRTDAQESTEIQPFRLRNLLKQLTSQSVHRGALPRTYVRR